MSVIVEERIQITEARREGNRGSDVSSENTEGSLDERGLFVRDVTLEREYG